MVDLIRAIQAIEVESAVVAELVVTADLDAPVPSCPGWALRDLVLHLGRVQRSWGEHLRAGTPDIPWQGTHVEPRTDADLAEWFVASTGALVSALESVGSGAPCWTWWGEPRTSDAVARHQVQEAGVHRWDAQSALGTPAPLRSDLAHDGVAEFLEVMTDPDPTAVTAQVAFEAPDTGGRWRIGPDAPTRLTVRATASDLVLLLYRRLPVSAVVLDGDADALVALFATFDTE
jgi:uncharacterized protein (TIGR03083 family)